MQSNYDIDLARLTQKQLIAKFKVDKAQRLATTENITAPSIKTLKPHRNQRQQLDTPRRTKRKVSAGSKRAKIDGYRNLRQHGSHRFYFCQLTLEDLKTTLYGDKQETAVRKVTLDKLLKLTGTGKQRFMENTGALVGYVQENGVTTQHEGYMTADADMALTTNNSRRNNNKNSSSSDNNNSSSISNNNSGSSDNNNNNSDNTNTNNRHGRLGSLQLVAYDLVKQLMRLRNYEYHWKHHINSGGGVNADTNILVGDDIRSSGEISSGGNLSVGGSIITIGNVKTGNKLPTVPSSKVVSPGVYQNFPQATSTTQLVTDSFVLANVEPNEESPPTHLMIFATRLRDIVAVDDAHEYDGQDIDVLDEDLGEDPDEDFVTGGVAMDDDHDDEGTDDHDAQGGNAQAFSDYGQQCNNDKQNSMVQRKCKVACSPSLAELSVTRSTSLKTCIIETFETRSIKYLEHCIKMKIKDFSNAHIKVLVTYLYDRLTGGTGVTWPTSVE
ncbi:unnamed protein product [Absidia cylindrospora]